MQEVEGARGAYANECGRRPKDEGYHAWKIYTLTVDGRQGSETKDDGVASHRWVNKDELKRMAGLTKAWYDAGQPKDDSWGDKVNPYKERLEPIWVVHFTKAGVLDVDYQFVLEDTPEIPIEDGLPE